VDFNDDGLLDLIVGEYGVKTGTPTGKVRFFERESVDLLKQSVALQCAGEEITNRYTSPCVVDWNNDGKLDLVLGSNHGVAQLFLNTGTRSAYRFDAAVELTDRAGEPIGVKHGRQQIRVLDLDGDGKKDLVTCGWNVDPDGELFFLYKNIGTDEAPAFEPPETLSYQDGSEVRTRKKHCNARFTIHDVNADGILDLIFVDYRDHYYNPVKVCLGTLQAPLSGPSGTMPADHGSPR
jgi:hypothetical protein